MATPSILRSPPLTASLRSWLRLAAWRRFAEAVPVDSSRDHDRFPVGGGICLAALLLTFLLAGTVGHDPWKPDEAYTFGLVLHILRSGDWVVPALAGEPFMEKPPLYYLAAAGTAHLFSPFLPLHDAARLTSTLFMLATLVFAGLSARRLFGPAHGLRVALLLLGCIGLTLYAHTMITDMALMTGFAVALYGLCWALDRPLFAGAFLGTGVGIGFMSKGLVEPAMIGIAVMLLPAVFREWRSRNFLAALAWAALFASPWLVAWPVALHGRDPALFREWFWINNFGRFFGFVDLGAYSESLYFTRTLPWFSLPAGPLAVYAVARVAWKRGRRIPQGFQIVVAMCAGILMVLGTSASVRELYALPLLVPLCVGACPAVADVHARLGMAAAKATGLLALCVGVFAWGTWIFAMIQGRPPVLPVIFHYLPADFAFEFHPLPVACALAATGLWLALWRMRPGPHPWLTLWTANVSFGWVVVMTLLLPWLDNAKSFREPFESMAEYLQGPDCVTSIGLGEGQRGMLDYLTHTRTYRLERAPRDCPLTLVQTSRDGTYSAMPPGPWRLLWEGSRNGESRERFLLFGKEEVALLARGSRGVSALRR